MGIYEVEPMYKTAARLRMEARQYLADDLISEERAMVKVKPPKQSPRMGKSQNMLGKDGQVSCEAPWVRQGNPGEPCTG